MDPSGTPCFLHVPKCGGVSLYASLAAPFPRDAIYPIPLPPPGDWLDRARFPIAVVDDLVAAHRAFDGPLAERCRLVMGHFDRGVCAQARLAPFTVLRDPVDRVVSQYRHAARTPDPWNRYLHDRIAAGMRIEDMAADPHLVDAFARAQARQLAGCLWSPDAPTLDDDALLAAALDGLDRCIAVGVTERLDASVLVIADAFGWPAPPPVARLNAAPHAGGPAVDEELRAGIRDVCRIDVTLYTRARERFDGAWRALVSRVVPEVDPDAPDAPARLRRAWPRGGSALE